MGKGGKKRKGKEVEGRSIGRGFAPRFIVIYPPWATLV